MMIKREGRNFGRPSFAQYRCYTKIHLDIFFFAVYCTYGGGNMPTTKKRVNLSLPDAVYEQLQKYKEQYGITNDATACLQLVVQQLKANEQTQLLIKMFMALSADEVAKLSADGSRALRKMLEHINDNTLPEGDNTALQRLLEGQA